MRGPPSSGRPISQAHPPEAESVDPRGAQTRALGTVCQAVVTPVADGCGNEAQAGSRVRPTGRAQPAVPFPSPPAARGGAAVPRGPLPWVTDPLRSLGRAPGNRGFCPLWTPEEGSSPPTQSKGTVSRSLGHGTRRAPGPGVHADGPQAQGTRRNRP